ncbi:hypothetical protein ACFVS2_26790 [Brevibacillus sp. NPDC058079]|uniref:hypothetical protein n=1 Tax=Brevibacillus sp. NPDC058079 TaxID=3346330 RepID=UPI0036E72C80
MFRKKYQLEFKEEEYKEETTEQKVPRAKINWSEHFDTSRGYIRQIFSIIGFHSGYGVVHEGVYLPSGEANQICEYVEGEMFIVSQYGNSKRNSYYLVRINPQKRNQFEIVDMACEEKMSSSFPYPENMLVKTIIDEKLIHVNLIK